MKTCTLCGVPLTGLPYVEVHCPVCSEALSKTSKARLESLLNKRDITPEERKERDALIAKQLREASDKL